MFPTFLTVHLHLVLFCNYASDIRSRAKGCGFILYDRFMVLTVLEEFTNVSVYWRSRYLSPNSLCKQSKETFS